MASSCIQVTAKKLKKNNEEKKQWKIDKNQKVKFLEQQNISSDFKTFPETECEILKK